MTGFRARRSDLRGPLPAPYTYIDSFLFTGALAALLSEVIVFIWVTFGFSTTAALLAIELADC